MQFKGNGYITVFFSLVLSIMLSLILTLFEGARSSAATMRAECATYTAAQSVLAEYHRELLEQYDLFYIDTSYGSTLPDYHNTEEHLRYYVDQNIRPVENSGMFKEQEWIRLGVDDMLISHATIATDSGGESMRRQVCDYMQDKLGISYIEKLLGWIDTVETYELDSDKVERNWDSAESQLNTLSEEDWKEVDVNSPATEIHNEKNSFTLSLVLSESEETALSDKTVNLENYVTLREKNKGSGYDAALGNGGLFDKVFLVEYMREKFSSYEDLLDKSADENANEELLDYQLEYILCGKNSDYQNLKSTVNRILLIREAANALYLPTDQQKMNEMKTVGQGVEALTGCPGLGSVVVATLICAWSYWESMEDIKALLRGESIPILKNSTTWKTNFESFMSGKEVSTSGNKDKQSPDELSYEDYVILMLYLKNETLATYHCMDLMEMSIRQTEGNENFRMDGCIDQMVLQVSYRVMDTKTYEIKRKYGYY